MPTASRAGLTLLELMLTMSLLSLVLGVGIGMLSSVNPGERAAVGIVQNVLRSAANTAIARNAPARVLIDPVEGTIEARGMRVIGTWHFEDEDHRGAFELYGATVGGGRLVDDGYQGRALGFWKEPAGARWETQVKDLPSWDLGDGFTVSLAIRQEEQRDMRLLTIGDSFAIGLTALGGVQAFFVPRITGESGRTSSGGRVWLRSEPGVLRPERLERVELRYDRRQFQLLLNDVLVALLDETAPVWEVEGPMIVAGGNLGTPVSIDSLIVAAVDGEDRSELADGVTFAPESAKLVQFTAGGALEPEVHRAPVEVILEFEDGQREVVRVSLYGTVE